MRAWMARGLFPFSLAVGLAILMKGHTDAGDGFSAGGIAGLGAATLYACMDHGEARRLAWADHAFRIAAGGLLIVLAIMWLPIFAGLPPASHHPGPFEHVTTLGRLALHTSVAFDVGVALAVYGVFVGTFDRVLPPFVGGAR